MPKFTATRFNELAEKLAKQLDLETQADVAAVLGISRRNFIRFAHNQAPVSPNVRRLLLMLVKHGPLKRSEEW